MILPTLASRMKETYEPAGLCVERTNIAPFPCVASKTGIGEVVRNRLSAMFAAADVVYLMRRIRIVFVKEAILAPIANAFCDESPQRLAYVISQAGCVGVPAPSP